MWGKLRYTGVKGGIRWKQYVDSNSYISYIDKPQIDTIAEKLMITGKNTAFIVSIYNRQWVWDKERESELVEVLYNSALKVIGDIDKDRIGLSIVEGLFYNGWE